MCCLCIYICWSNGTNIALLMWGNSNTTVSSVGAWLAYSPPGYQRCWRTSNLDTEKHPKWVYRGCVWIHPSVVNCALRVWRGNMSEKPYEKYRLKTLHRLWQIPSGWHLTGHKGWYHATPLNATIVTSLFFFYSYIFGNSTISPHRGCSVHWLVPSPPPPTNSNSNIKVLYFNCIYSHIASHIITSHTYTKNIVALKYQTFKYTLSWMKIFEHFFTCLSFILETKVMYSGSKQWVILHTTNLNVELKLCIIDFATKIYIGIFIFCIKFVIYICFNLTTTLVCWKFISQSSTVTISFFTRTMVFFQTLTLSDGTLSYHLGTWFSVSLAH